MIYLPGVKEKPLFDEKIAHSARLGQELDTREKDRSMLSV
jgi:hypothetical protein